MYYGSRLSQIDLRLRDNLRKYIVPSSRASLLVAPNFFREDKGTSRRADVAQRQVILDLAVGARCMLQLQNYSNATPIYDRNVYTIALSYYPSTGTLQVYATHPSQPTSAAGEPQYYMTQLDTYVMTGNINSFRSGAAAYRNAREWTQQQRNCFIANANAVVQRRSTETRSFSRTKNNTIVSSVVADESTSSETSTDELALDYNTAAKRRRRLKSLKPVNLYPFDIRSCQRFNILGQLGAFSGPHVESNRATQVRNYFRYKLWMFVPKSELGPKDWKHFLEDGDRQDTKGKCRGVILELGDVFVMELGLVHAVNTLSNNEPCLTPQARRCTNLRRSERMQSIVNAYLSTVV